MVYNYCWLTDLANLFTDWLILSVTNILSGACSIVDKYSDGQEILCCHDTVFTEACHWILCLGFLWGVSTNTLYTFLVSSMHAVCLAHLSLVDLYNRFYLAPSCVTDQEQCFLQMASITSWMGVKFGLAMEVWQRLWLSLPKHPSWMIKLVW